MSGYGLEGRAGFTLIEALVAATLASVLVVLVSGVFLVQNQYYALQLKRAIVQDNARSVTAMMASDLRSAMKGSVLVAEPARVVVRTPLALSVICATQGPDVFAYLDGGEATLDTTDVAGFAVRDSVGAWSYYNATWKTLSGAGGSPGASCAAQGADTVGASADFVRLKRLGSYHSPPPGIGEVLMFFAETEYGFATSALDSTSRALYRGPYGGTLVEFVTGMDSTAGFAYRTGGTTYVPSVSGPALLNIDAIRVDAEARTHAETGGRSDVTYGWSVSVPLRNAR